MIHPFRRSIAIGLGRLTVVAAILILATAQHAVSATKTVPPQNHAETVTGEGHAEKMSPSPAGPDDALESDYIFKLKENTKPKPKPVVKDYQHEIDTARQLRRNKDTVNAEKMLSNLIDSGPPDQFKRAALFELALVAQDERKLSRAQQIFAHYVQLYPQDPAVPEVLLRQGLLYREIGAYNMAVGKYYSVMNSALSLKLDQFDYYKRLVLQAQTEIAETYFLQGRFSEAADFFRRILKQKTVELNRSQVHFKLIQCYAGMAKHTDVVSQVEKFIEDNPDSADVPEARYLAATAYKGLGRSREAHSEVMKLLRSQADAMNTNPERWIYWQQRAGNDIANQLYLDGDYLNALEVYTHLASLSDGPAWQVPIWYQTGLIYEKLNQPKKAAESYAAIAGREPSLLGTNSTSSVKTVIEMARWRSEQIAWREKTDIEVQSLRLNALSRSGTNTASIKP
jgi:tetratricopeptide (TPR) repeat protein